MMNTLREVRIEYPLAFHRYLQYGYVGREPLGISVLILDAKRELEEVEA